MRTIHITNKDTWIGFDLDGTISKFCDIEWANDMNWIGEPIPNMITLIKHLIVHDINVKIFTARASRDCAIPAVTKWIKEHIGHELEITNVKDFHCAAIFDDRSHQVMFNTGKIQDVVHIINDGQNILI